MKIFIDPNIPMYVAASDHPNKGPAQRLLRQIQAGRVAACSSTEVLQEILYRYFAIRRLDLGVEVYDLFVQICPEILDVTLADTDRARDLLVDQRDLSARDAVHAGVMLNHEVQRIATFDTGFDQVPGIERVELI